VLNSSLSLSIRVLFVQIITTRQPNVVIFSDYVIPTFLKI
jgi:hypothetical protein